ncbi:MULTISPECIES: LysR family transcriptional regulator [Pseudomonas]|uniref:LysR family transcriptional regulator n=1 Tax=Pseudomonas TaxID=286 RepID=UPI0004AC07A7|nr:MULTISPECIES: LysR family transcriptional regulator [Pseudomonas]AIC21216.1 LysR family transcriptional regulator [Pseudomonas chlororaphis]AZD87397.1 Transcriptional regulator, LysR family [Pseudomonas chlororaphis subsp. aureofaciens]AZD93844.1 Transcriptional regulator, LysR family [Pseudomonas chlororaphis subsp. aureofaciens]AZE00152.1 Transcriptional regulator, LysR family [Pseudomonas chlororaphis subsp. aureofaciens]AZE06249.1 Transcriptional regulator, LysR family [Pseudomonas chlo
MDFNAVRMFVSVAQTGSLSAAAERLEIPLPTLSRRIRELEQQLKVQLLERSVRGTKLTDSGARLYEHASRGIEALVEGEQAVISDQALLKGRLRLSLPPAFEPWWDVLSAFQRRYPQIEVSVHTTERRIDLIEDGVDVALRVGAITHETMVARRLLSYRHLLVASPGLIERLGPPSSVEALNAYPCGVWSQGSPGTWQLGDVAFRPRAMLATNDYAHLRSRALAGDLVTELPPFLAAHAIREGRLLALLPGHPLPEQQINLLYPSHRHPSAIVRAYLDFAQGYMGYLTEVSSTRQ